MLAARATSRCATTGSTAVDDVDPRRSPPVRCSRCWARRAAASRRCCARSPASSRWSVGRIRVDGADLAGVPTHKRGCRADVPGRPALRPPHAWPATSATRSGCGTCPRSRSQDRVARAAGPGRARRGTPTGCRPPSRAASGSGWPWPGRWRSSPGVLLLDEPLSALDAGAARAPRRRAGRGSCARPATTAVLVTHDHEEAFAVADRMAVMRGGRIVQEGPIAEVWRQPADAETALFLGYARVLSGDGRRDGRRASRPARRATGDRPAPFRARGGRTTGRWSAPWSPPGPPPTRCGW